MLGLGATIITNKRRIAADDFFKGMFETALEPDEIITKVQLPDRQEGGLREVPQPGLGLCAGRRVRVASAARDIRVAVTGAGSNGVFRVKSFEEALKKRFSPKSLEGMTIPADGMNARHPRQRRIPRASGRRAGAPGAGEGVAVAAAATYLCVWATRDGVMPGLVPGIDVSGAHDSKAGMAATSSAMTE